LIDARRQKKIVIALLYLRQRQIERSHPWPPVG
jgi:hypothetical protein